MIAFIGLLSLLAFVVFLILAIISSVRKNGKAKLQFIITGSLFIIFVVAIILTPTPEETDDKIVSNSSSSVETVVNVDSTEKDNEEEKKKKEAEKIAKAEAEEKKKAEAEAKKAEELAKKKAEEEARIKAEQERLKNPDWNTSEVDIMENGNLYLALDMLSVMDEMPPGEYIDSEDVFKTPWNYYGTPIEFSGWVAVVEDFPPGSNEVGLASDIVIETYEGTIVEFFSTVPSGKIRVGDEVIITGYPIGRTAVDNTMGGSYTHLIVVTNNVDQ